MVWWFLRTLSAGLFLFGIIFSIPLAFDVGGRTCGLAFSLALATFYFLYSFLRLVTPEQSRVLKTLVGLVATIQWLVIPTLLIWSLNKFSVDSGDTWVEQTFGHTRTKWQSPQEWFFGRDGLLEVVTIGSWDKLLRWSTPVFQLSEGFCSLLLIQAVGQVTKYLVNQDSGDAWMIGLLVGSASGISTSLYFLWRITTFPDIDNIDAILIGVAITCAFFLGAWGIGSGRGNPAESALLFAYVTLCIYQIFTDYQPSAGSVAAAAPPLEPNFPPFPPIIMASYSTLIHALSTLPSTIHTAFNFLMAAIMTITPSVLISLAYRLFAMYAAARIIPAVRDSGSRALSQEPSLDDSDGVGRFMGLLSYFSPSILIAVYTSLLMQHFASNSTDHSGEWWTSQGGDVGSNVWRWINLAGTMILYAVELYLGKDHDDTTLTSHWKID